jgi:hypothetical protein
MNNQTQEALSLTADVCILVGLVSIPAGASPYVGLGIAIVGAVGAGILKFLGTSNTPQTVLDSLGAFAVAYEAMTPEQRTALLAQLPTLLPLLVKPQPAKT